VLPRPLSCIGKRTRRERDGRKGKDKKGEDKKGEEKGTGGGGEGGEDTGEGRGREEGKECPRFLVKSTTLEETTHEFSSRTWRNIAHEISNAGFAALNKKLVLSREASCL